MIFKETPLKGVHHRAEPIRDERGFLQFKPTRNSRQQLSFNKREGMRVCTVREAPHSEVKLVVCPRLATT
jgi:hypothetical protein